MTQIKEREKIKWLNISRAGGVAQLVECLASMWKPWVSFLTPHILSIAMFTCNCSTQKVEGRRNLDYIA